MNTARKLTLRRVLHTVTIADPADACRSDRVETVAYYGFSLYFIETATWSADPDSIDPIDPGHSLDAGQCKNEADTIREAFEIHDARVAKIREAIEIRRQAGQGRRP
jgi:hypothetical protein